MALVLDGKKARDFYKGALAKRVAALRAQGIVPRLAILQVGDDPSSTIYIGQKKKFALDIGADVEHVRFAADATQADIAAKVSTLNADANVDGVILQLPIPAHLDKLALINLIDPKKDVDGLTDESQRLLDAGTPGFVPATAKGVMTLLDFYKISVQRKKATVFGRSRLVGHPTAELLKMRGAEVSVIHSQTPNPQEASGRADIVVVAIGKPRYLTADFIKDGATVVDVGITSVGGKAVGDVAYDSVSIKAEAVSPVPGGVGPMTVLSLFDNLILSVERYRLKK